MCIRDRALVDGDGPTERGPEPDLGALGDRHRIDGGTPVRERDGPRRPGVVAEYTESQDADIRIGTDQHRWAGVASLGVADVVDADEVGVARAVGTVGGLLVGAGEDR